MFASGQMVACCLSGRGRTEEMCAGVALSRLHPLGCVWAGAPEGGDSQPSLF